MLTANLTHSLRILHRTSIHRPLRSYCCTASPSRLQSSSAIDSTHMSNNCIAVTFSDEQAQQEFGKTFQLADGVDASIVQVPVCESSELPVGGVNCTSSSSSTANSNAISSCFNAGELMQHLQTRKMGHILLTTASIPSTQEFMRQHASCLPDGAVLVADQQTRGKGRGGNTWTSPDGCLMFTALRRLQVPGNQATFINYVVCLAVVQGVKDATRGLVQDGLNLQIKWPNDIYYNGLKVGGALIHSTWTSAKFCVLTGIGLNVSNSQPTTCLNDIIAQQHKQQQQQQQFHHSTADALPADGVSSGRVNNEQLLACVLGHLERCFDQFEQHGFEPLRALYISNWMHSDQVVQLQEDGTAGGAVELTIKGLSPHGFLLAVDSCGQRYELTPDGNSLDMMQGLLKKKLY